MRKPQRPPQGKEARKAGYSTICEIGEERIRRAGKQIMERELECLEKAGIIEKSDSTECDAQDTEEQAGGAISQQQLARLAALCAAASSGMSLVCNGRSNSFATRSRPRLRREIRLVCGDK